MSASMVNFPLVSVALVPIAFAAIPWGASPSVGALPEAGQLRVLSSAFTLPEKDELPPGVTSYEEAKKNQVFAII